MVCLLFGFNNERNKTMVYYDWEQYRNIEELKGQIAVNIVHIEHDGNDALQFEMEDGSEYIMTHIQDCCENVYIEEIIGDLDDLIGVPFVEADEESNVEDDQEDDYRTRWTFYKLGTSKGFVTLRWYGSSNGYYSEDVDFIKVK